MCVFLNFTTTKVLEVSKKFASTQQHTGWETLLKGMMNILQQAMN